MSVLLAPHFAVVLLLPSCFSSSDGEALQRDVAVLKNQVSNEIGKAETKRKQLQKVMEQATALLTRNSADVGAQVERIQNQNNKLNGQIEELPSLPKRDVASQLLDRVAKSRGGHE